MEKVVKLIVLGASGLIGHKVFNLKKIKNLNFISFKTTKVCRDTELIDLTNFSQLEVFIAKVKPILL